MGHARPGARRHDRATTLAMLAPAGRAKNRILRLLGHDVHSDARIGPVVALGCDRFVIGRSVVAAGNVFRGLAEVRLADDAALGSYNWFTVAAEFRGWGPDACRLRLGRGAVITSRHYVDCSGGVTLADLALVSGVRSTLISHGLDDVDNVQDCAPIRLGESARLGSGNQVVMGATVPDRSVTAMGSVVLPGLTTPDRLYAGVPAREKKPVAGDWFHRTDSFTHVRPASAVRPVPSTPEDPAAPRRATAVATGAHR